MYPIVYAFFFFFKQHEVSWVLCGYSWIRPADLTFVDTFKSGGIGLPALTVMYEEISVRVLFPFPAIYKTLTAELVQPSVHETFRMILKGIK